MILDENAVIFGDDVVIGSGSSGNKGYSQPRHSNRGSV